LVFSGRPAKDSLLGQSIHLTQKAGGAFDPLSPSALITAVFGSPGAQLSALGGGDAIEALLTGFRTSQDPRRVQRSSGAAAGGFATFAAEQIKGAWGHRSAPEQGSEEAVEAVEGARDLLAHFGRVGAHLYL